MAKGSYLGDAVGHWPSMRRVRPDRTAWGSGPGGKSSIRAAFRAMAVHNVRTASAQPRREARERRDIPDAGIAVNGAGPDPQRQTAGHPPESFSNHVAECAAVEEHADLMAARRLFSEVDDMPEQAAERRPEDVRDPQFLGAHLLAAAISMVRIELGDQGRRGSEKKTFPNGNNVARPDRECDRRRRSDRDPVDDAREIDAFLRPAGGEPSCDSDRVLNSHPIDERILAGTPTSPSRNCPRRR